MDAKQIVDRLFGSVAHLILVRSSLLILVLRANALIDDASSVERNKEKVNPNAAAMKVCCTSVANRPRRSLKFSLHHSLW